MDQSGVEFWNQEILKTIGVLNDAGLLGGKDQPVDTKPAPDPINYKPWLIGGGVLVGIIVLVLLFRK